MNVLRRALLKGAGAGGALAALLVTGLMKPIQALAAEWNKGAFGAKDLAGAIRELGGGAPVDSRDIIIKAPDVAEDGAVVPVDILSRIPGTTQISVLVEKNPNPLAVSYNFANGALPEVHMRLKFSDSSMMKVVVRAGGKSYQAQREIRVTVGGCAA